MNAEVRANSNNDKEINARKPVFLESVIATRTVGIKRDFGKQS